MEHCYGRSGRAAVSFFQFAFAFGGSLNVISRSVGLLMDFTRHVRIWDHYWFVDNASSPSPSLILARWHYSACCPVDISSTFHHTRPKNLRSTAVHYCAMHNLCLLSIITVPRHSQTVSCLGFRIGRYGNYSGFSPHRKRESIARSEGRSYTTLHLYTTTTSAGNRRHQFRVCLSSQFSPHLWELTHPHIGPLFHRDAYLNCILTHFLFDTRNLGIRGLYQ